MVDTMDDKGNGARAPGDKTPGDKDLAAGPPAGSMGAASGTPGAGAPRASGDRKSDTQYRVMRLIEQNPEMSQRDLARALGVSLGGVHYCLRALIEKGLVKARAFASSPRKGAYSYVLTPAGLAEKSALTRSFLSRKRAEYDALKKEIAALEAEIGTGSARWSAPEWTGPHDGNFAERRRAARLDARRTDATKI